jgi:hypothetical protein
MTKKDIASNIEREVAASILECPVPVRVGGIRIFVSKVVFVESDKCIAHLNFDNRHLSRLN